jgi:hypothetical protein
MEQGAVGNDLQHQDLCGSSLKQVGAWRKGEAMKRLVSVAVVFLVWLFAPGGFPYVASADDIQFHTDPPQRLDVPFRLFRTQNMWNQLLLDTRTGLLWQVAFSVEEKGLRMKIPINVTLLASGANATIGRFTLYPTDNMWNFLLLDQLDGRAWLCQFSAKPDLQGCRNLLPSEP